MKWLPLLCVMVIAHAAPGAEGDLPNATLIVYNPNYPESKSLAEYYAARRAVPKDRLTALPCSNDEEIDRHEYDTQLPSRSGSIFRKRNYGPLIKPLNQGSPLTRSGILFSSVESP